MKKILFTIALSSLVATSAFADKCTNLDEANLDDTLELDGCYVEDMKMIDNIISYANAHPLITRIDLRNNLIHDKSVKKLMSMQYVTDFDLARNRLTDESAKTVSNNNKIEYIVLDDNNITDAGVAELVKNRSLKVIGLSHTRITDKAATYLAESSAPWLDIEYNNLGDASAIALAQHRNLQQLHMSDNNVGDEGAKAFARAKFDLPQGVPGILIDLNYNQIGAEGIAAMNTNEQISVDTSYNPGSSQQDNNRKLGNSNIKKHK